MASTWESHTRVWQKEMSVVPICFFLWVMQNVGILFIMTFCSIFDFLTYCINICLFSSFLEVCCLVTKSCPTLCDPMDYSLPGSSVHGIFQTRILKWVAISFSREFSWPRNQTHFSCTSCIARRILYHSEPMIVKQIKLSVYTGGLEQLWGRETSIIWGVILCQAQVDSKDTKLKHPWSLCLVIPNTVGNTKPEECTGEAQMRHCILPSPGKGGQRGPLKTGIII